MAIQVPAATSAPSLGNIKVAAVVAVASTAAPDLSSEIDAGTSVDLSCAFLAEGWNPTGTQAKTTRKRRLCSKSDVETLGPTTFSIDALQYSVGDPQSPDASTTALMVEGARVYLVERLGKDADTAWAVGDDTLTHYVELGAPIQMRDAGSDNGEFYIQQSVVYVNQSGPAAGTVVA